MLTFQQPMPPNTNSNQPEQQEKVFLPRTSESEQLKKFVILHPM
ncbi:hypothetical protein RINTHM_1030 [Richelia intracellularis HM01]|nr:hypothetical protein RINTHM_1030 [Richelia intracellularis HM01]